MCFVGLYVGAHALTGTAVGKPLVEKPGAVPLDPKLKTCKSIPAGDFNRLLKIRKRLGGPSPKKWASKPVCVRPHVLRIRADIKRLKRVPKTYPGWSRHSGWVVHTAIKKAKRMGATCKTMLAMIEAGIVESKLRDLNYGHADSIGWLQQRPSMGWRYAGNVAMAAWDFLRRAMRLNQSQSAGSLAQAVQRSAFPHKYDQERGRATRILKRAVPRCA